MLWQVPQAIKRMSFVLWKISKRSLKILEILDDNMQDKTWVILWQDTIMFDIRYYFGSHPNVFK